MGGLFISASGVLNALRRSEITANNVANLRTTGFRAARAESVESAGGGVELGAVSRGGGSGPVEVTGRPLDVTSGDGFFRVRRGDGSLAFTRDGHFGLNANGEIVTAGGARLDPPLTAPPNATSVSVSADGRVFASAGTGEEPQLLGRIEVFIFPNMEGLEAVGGNLYRQSTASGEAFRVTGELMPGAVQGSNVNLAAEQVNSVLNRHAFQANLNAFRAQSDMLGELLNLQE